SSAHRRLLPNSRAVSRLSGSFCLCLIPYSKQVRKQAAAALLMRMGTIQEFFRVRESPVTQWFLAAYVSVGSELPTTPSIRLKISEMDLRRVDTCQRYHRFHDDLQSQCRVERVSRHDDDFSGGEGNHEGPL